MLTGNTFLPHLEKNIYEQHIVHRSRRPDNRVAAWSFLLQRDWTDSHSYCGCSDCAPSRDYPASLMLFRVGQ